MEEQWTGLVTHEHEHEQLKGFSGQQAGRQVHVEGKQCVHEGLV